MTWPGRQRRALRRTEKQLLAADLHLDSMYAVFTRLSGTDAMPLTEQIESGPRRLLRLAWKRGRSRPRPQGSAASRASGTR